VDLLRYHCWDFNLHFSSITLLIAFAHQLQLYSNWHCKGRIQKWRSKSWLQLLLFEELEITMQSNMVARNWLALVSTSDRCIQVKNNHGLSEVPK
jgi:hypothetical protein